MPEVQPGRKTEIVTAFPQHRRSDSFRVGRGMNMALAHRRLFLRLAASAAALPNASRLAWGQAYPSRPVHWIVGFAPGGGNDIIARLTGQWLSERLGQPFIIENRPGAGTNLAAAIVVHAPADGYTLFLANTASAINATLYEKLNFNFIRDIAPVAGIARVPLVLLINPSMPFATVDEFIAYAKANPGKLNMASAGTGSGGHLAGELFKAKTGVNLVHIPYRGNGPALSALLAGEAQVLFPTVPSALGFIKSGKLRALAVTTTTRQEDLPDLPALSESVPDYEASTWYGIGVPRNTPAEIINKLNAETNAVLADPKMKARLAEVGGVVLAGSPGDLGQLISDETEKWAKVIRAANITAQ
jgi:tripartite-type tricarboxylate transporter receptor subunit TctC